MGFGTVGFGVVGFGLLGLGKVWQNRQVTGKACSALVCLCRVRYGNNHQCDGYGTAGCGVIWRGLVRIGKVGFRYGTVTPSKEMGAVGCDPACYGPVR